MRSAPPVAAVFTALTLALLLPRVAAQPAETTASPERFDIVRTVLQSPRCLNCHVSADFPRQGDERRQHDYGVRRGDDGHGVAAMRCAACHTDRNNGAFPGAPHWGLAPRSQSWEGLDAATLCRTLKDRRLNGGRSIDQLLTHMSDDPLVAWAWAPGGSRAPVPVARDKFVKGIQAWAEAGAPCPERGP